MGRKIAIGIAWWLAAAYVLQFAAHMYGFPTSAASLAAIPIALAVAATRPARVRRPADLRRIYRLPENDAIPAEPQVVIGR